MKRLIAYILSVFVMSGASGATASRALPSGNSNATADTTATSTSTRGDGDASRSAVSRATRSNATATSTSGTGTVSSRATAARGTTANVSSSRTGLDAATNTVGRNSTRAASSINNTAPVRRAGLTLRPSTAEVGGRATIGNTGVQTGSNVGNSVRALQSRAGTAKNQRETISEAKERLEQTAELNKSCQEQYNDCMDQFCAVVDSNQKRCSCSANLSRYTKVETAVKDANSQLNDVAQRIRYVGLSADEISAIMSATEAEEALSGSRDTSETRSMLDDIAALIKDPSSSTSSVAGTDGISLMDMNLDFSDSSDLFSLDFLNNNSSSISNLRGTELYNAAKKRCNSILTQCKDAGATKDQITSNYDLAIDRDCIAYEAGLNKMNETLVSNVRSANLMLQKARLAVLQNKNEYDAKGCIAALDACMTDEMVCGENYEKCLDPTKKYIDENGEVVLGMDVTNIRDLMYAYDNSQINTKFLTDAAGLLISDNTCKPYPVYQNGNTLTAYTDGTVGSSENDKGTYVKNVGNGSCTVAYLLQKIGTGAKSTDGGLCRAVLDKCQRYTYDSNGNYNKYNDIVVNYIQRAMVNIKSGQEKIISDYASNCMLDVAACYNQQVTQINTWTTSAAASSIKNVMNGACRNVALTCGMAIYDNNSCEMDGYTDDSPQCYIEEVSKIFYQSMLCPENSEYVSKSRTEVLELIENDGSTCSPERARSNDMTCTPIHLTGVGITGWSKDLFWSTIYSGDRIITSTDVYSAYVNEYCRCKVGYEVFGSSCVQKCGGKNMERNPTTGICVCKSGYSLKNGVCSPSGE
ncbi:hypothetical protein HDR61_01420 [bacterium]|nr:hypothetical protein [bacterium]